MSIAHASQKGKSKKQSKNRVINHPMSRRFESAVFALASETLSSLSGEVPAQQLRGLLNGDLLSVVSAEVDPSAFKDASSFADAYLSVELLSKYPNWDIGIDKTAVAFAKFAQSEAQCAETNERLRQRHGYVNGVLSPYTPEAIMLMAREKISRLLGPFNWDHAERYFGFGPGATSSVRSRCGDAYFKYRAKPWTTRSNAVLAYACISRIPIWFNHVVTLSGKSPEEVQAMSLSERISTLFEITEGNRVITVPKSAKTERIIAIEPTMNGYVQHGIGGLIRSRLRRVGIDLNDQSKNQELALEGSIRDNLSTIDLSSASDTVAMQLVEELLPTDWTIAIKQARSPVGTLPDGTRIEYQKVSSMGNGMTFELESLIFWALSSAVSSYLRPIDRRVSVYGDDIIVPKQISHTLIWILNYCGFSCNMKKTFVNGDFRESCGKHYFRGTDVTPVYIRDDIDSPERAIWFANQIRRYSRLNWGLDGRFHTVYNQAVSLLPRVLRRPSIPDGYGDAALFGDFDEVLPHRCRSYDCICNRGYSGYTGTVHVRVLRTRQYGDDPYMIRALDKLDHSRSSPDLSDVVTALQNWDYFSRKMHGDLAFTSDGGVPIPSPVVKWKSLRIPVAQWSSYGPWLGS